MGILSHRSKYATNPIEEQDKLAYKLMKAGKKVLKLNRGDPPMYFKTPQFTVDAYKRALDEGRTGYSMAIGVPELKEAVAQRYKRRYGLDAGADKVLITQGISEALLMLNSNLLNEGDRAILFKPYYTIYVPYMQLFGGSPILERYDEDNNWNVDTESLERSLKREGKNKRVKYMMITNPNNPTGTVLSRNILKEIVDLANEYDMLLVSDEIYDELVFNKAKFTSICELAKGVPYIIFNGASKNYDATGFRTGFVIIPNDDKKSEAVLESLENFAVTRLSGNTPAQYAMVETLSNQKEHKKAVKAMVGEIEKRVNYASKLINESRYMHTVVPRGAFYIFPRVNFDQLKIKDDKVFTNLLLQEELVQITRGSGFGDGNHVRLVSLAPEEILETAIDKINKFCRRHAK